MRRYWVSKEKFEAGIVKIEGEDFRHICKVCRRNIGHRFEVLSEDHKAYFVEIVELGKNEAVAKVLEERVLPELPKPHIHLALSLPKFQTLERVLEKSVELGAHSLHLFSSDYSFMKPKALELKKKQARWGKIIKGATQQTGRGTLMELTEIKPLGVLLEEFSLQKNAYGLCAFEGEGQLSLKMALNQVGSEAESLWVFVGSEGGFSQEDLKLFNNYKLLPVSLGDQVLRVETACVTLLSILKYGVGHFDKIEEN